MDLLCIRRLSAAKAVFPCAGTERAKVASGVPKSLPLVWKQVAKCLERDPTVRQPDLRDGNSQPPASPAPAVHRSLFWSAASGCYWSLSSLWAINASAGPVLSACDKRVDKEGFLYPVRVCHIPGSLLWPEPLRSGLSFPFWVGGCD